MDQIGMLFEALTGAGGRTKIAKKVVEEAAEVALEAVAERRRGMIEESADLIYNLVVLWADAGLSPGDVWAEMDRRRARLGIAEKLPKPGQPAAAADVAAPRRAKPPKKAGKKAKGMAKPPKSAIRARRKAASVAVAPTAGTGG